MGMLDTRPHFFFSVMATAELLFKVWMKSGGPPPNLAPPAQNVEVLIIQQSYPTSWYAERSHDLIFYLIIYLAAIVLIWAHAFLWRRETISQAGIATVAAPK